MKECLEWATNSSIDVSALARVQFHLATLYKEHMIKDESAATPALEAHVKELEALSETFLKGYGHTAAECVRNSSDKLMILDDLQPTFLGRYTGHGLLKCLQENIK